MVHVHYNVPGILAEINKVFATNEINVTSQHLQTMGNLGVAISDIPTAVHEDFLGSLQRVNHTIKVRVLHTE